ncbi:hypothetical protein [Clostridium sp. HMP27]|uniref:hypothetical protein n=1 Tax=Clostridium sp. HMP27 TaxID=1487921 RepID=UPI00052CA2BD|nr:hypothetical protein [Clostridium sp. HMP27]KGK81735.1 hypothetical protein DP68_18070 [Clostridium sp. HMP27]
MKVKDEKVSKKSKKSTVTITLYIIALIVAIAGVTLLVNNIILFRNTVNQYVAQGYDYALVTSQIIPSQLLPGVCESVAVYGGIAFALLGIGAINEKTSKYLMLLTKVDDCNDAAEESILLEESKLQDDINNIQDIETAEYNETTQEVMQENEEEAIEV